MGTGFTGFLTDVEFCHNIYPSLDMVIIYMDAEAALISLHSNR